MAHYMLTRRRMMMAAAGGGGGFLYIYEPGYTAWKNATEGYKSSQVTLTMSAGAANATITSKSTSLNEYSIKIEESVYKNYKKLSITASVTGSSTYKKLYWSSSSNSTSGAATIASLTSQKVTYTYDISGSTGAKYILIRDMSSNSYAYTYNIYDIHLE